MRYNPGETMEEWSKRVAFFEYGIALTRMATKEENIQTILTEMANNITNKLSYPVLQVIKEAGKQNIEKELEESRIRYQKNYLDKFKPKSDHIL